MKVDPKTTATRFASAIIARDYAEAHRMLAPWLEAKLDPGELQTIVERGCRADAVPFGIREIDSTAATRIDLDGVDHPRAHLVDYAQGELLDQTVGPMGPPAFMFDPALTDENFRKWMIVELLPDPDAGTGLDYCLRLYLAIAEVDGALCVGHLEPELT